MECTIVLLVSLNLLFYHSCEKIKYYLLRLNQWTSWTGRQKKEELKRQFSNGDITVDQYTERLVSLLVWKELMSSFDTQALFIALECQV